MLLVILLIYMRSLHINKELCSLSETIAKRARTFGTVRKERLVEGLRKQDQRLGLSVFSSIEFNDDHTSFFLFVAVFCLQFGCLFLLCSISKYVCPLLYHFFFNIFSVPLWLISSVKYRLYNTEAQNL